MSIRNINDTIIAVSSGTTPCIKKIIRISGDKTFNFLQSFFGREFPKQKQISSALLKIEGFEIECFVYTFVSPNSYTGEDLAELHVCGCDELIQKIFSKFLEAGARAALGGEFTYRAYVNGKIDLSHAEAIAEMIESSNQFQLEAAQKLFGGSIEKKAGQARKDILELLSLIEAGLDFSAEDIEIISRKKAAQSAEKILNALNELLSGSITFEQISQAPTVVITGAANAGKSSLLNAIIGENRSIVSDQSGTTRDVLEHWLKLEKCDCVLVDSAGVITQTKDPLQILANQAALKAIADATVLIFCADITKENYNEDLEIMKQLGQTHGSAATIFAVTKCDLSNDEKIKMLEGSFKEKFIETSSQNKTGIEELKKAIELNLIQRGSFETSDKTALTERHKSAVSEAAKNIENAIAEIQNGNEEIAAYVLRNALQELSRLETEHIDEAILDNIFSKFCIGK
ncbi:MAG: GTPase [Phycisphaerales bacterium]